MKRKCRVYAVVLAATLLADLGPVVAADEIPGHHVASYQDALDHLTREFLYLLRKQKLLVVWCFDESESMKDDQAEVRARLDRVYQELTLARLPKDDMLSSVVSYGNRFHLHTREPTSDVKKIRNAIAAIPTDTSGKERMCQAIFRAITIHREQAAEESRRLVLILATDESGDRQENDEHLERIVKLANDAKCRVYVLGRAAVFGFPYAHFRWIHPRTRVAHSLRIDRGPETAFVQQLQIDGFGIRRDAISSGFGPYEQLRLVRETEGIFFAIPSIQPTLHQSQKGKYELAVMRSYMPDHRARVDVISDRERSRFRSAIWRVIQQLDPSYEKTQFKQLRTEFGEYTEAMKIAVIAAIRNERLYDELSDSLAAVRDDRAVESERRWQANYDLIRAELAVFRARSVEYSATLRQFIADPKQPPPDQGIRKFQFWQVGFRRETVGGDTSASMIQSAEKLLGDVIENHPSTPWAVRADLERQKGYGVELRPHLAPDPIKVPNAVQPPAL